MYDDIARYCRSLTTRQLTGTTATHYLGICSAVLVSGQLFDKMLMHIPTRLPAVLKSAAEFVTTVYADLADNTILTRDKTSVR